MSIQQRSVNSPMPIPFLRLAARQSRQDRRSPAQDPQARLGPAVHHAKEAVDVVLCWGWIDGYRQRASTTESYFQRVHATVGAAETSGAKINVRTIVCGVLIKRGRDDTPLGSPHWWFEAAKADGRWELGAVLPCGFEGHGFSGAILNRPQSGSRSLRQAEYAEKSGQNRFAARASPFIKTLKTEAGVDGRRRSADFVRYWILAGCRYHLSAEGDT